MSNSRVLVLGAYGRLGSVLTPFLESYGYEIFRQGRNEGAQIQLDPINPTKLSDLLKRIRPQVIINLIALTNVDSCQSNLNLAYISNVKVVEAIATAMGSLDFEAHLIQISTDHVYDGIGLNEETNINLLNVYALTKYAGEIAARAVGATILRTNYIGKSSSLSKEQSISDWIVNSVLNSQPITLLKDVHFSPLHVTSLCYFISQVMQFRKSGTYNLGAIGSITKADFGLRLLTGLDMDCSDLILGKLADIRLEARRPHNMAMDCKKIMTEFNFDLPEINQEIEILVNDY